MLEAIVGVALRAILASIVLGGALALLVFAATRILALTAATRHALWTTALVATAVMPLAGITVSALRATSAPAIVSSPPSHGSLARHLPPPHRNVAAHRAPAIPTHMSSPAVPPHAVASVDAFSFAPHVTRALAVGIASAWALGAVIGLIGLAASVWRVRGLKRRSSPLDAALADELPWLTDVGPGREIYLRLSYEIETPVAIGFRRPVILIPTELASAEGLAAIEPLVLHEHAHLRRYDDWTNLAQRMIERLFWFNPIVWLLGRRIALEREIASDDAVVEKTGAPREYATSLWRLAREMRMPEHAVVAPGALLTRKQISVRIEQLLDANRSRLHRSPAAALGVATAGIVAVVLVATSSPAVELPSAPAAPLLAAAVPPQLVRQAAPHHAAVALAPPHAVVAQAAPTATPLPTTIPTAQPAAVAPAASPAPRALSGRPTLSPAALEKVHNAEAQAQNAERARASEMQRAADAASIAAKAAASANASVESTLRDALGSLPSQIGGAFDGNTSARHTRLDGVKLSREMVASCVGCSMRGADLRGLDLHGLKITGDDLRDADMRGVNLAGAHLAGTSLAGADLSSADLRNASLSGVELRDTKLDGALLDGIKLTGISLKTVSLNGTAMRSVLGNCVGCDFGRLDLHGQDLHGIVLRGADLSNADLHDANLSGAHFTGVNLSHANLAGADLSDTRFDGCEMGDVDLRGARTTGMVLHGSGFE